MTTGVVTPCARMASRSAIPSMPGITTSEKIKSNDPAFSNSSALGPLSATTASSPAKRKARESEASVLASSSTISNLDIQAPLRGQLYYERCALARHAFHPNPSVMIADHALHNCQTETCAMLLGGVVGREQARALFFGETLPGVGDFDA